MLINLDTNLQIVQKLTEERKQEVQALVTTDGEIDDKEFEQKVELWEENINIENLKEADRELLERAKLIVEIIHLKQG